MASPITWRNVEAPDLRGAASMLNLAQSGFNSGFDQLNNVLKREQDTAEANWKVQRDNNTQAFLNSINQYRTPEEYQAALQSGALDLSKYGAQIDQAVARSALDGRLSILQDRMVKANQFADMQQERDARPIVDRLTAMALSDDKDLRRSAKEALGIYAGQGMVPKAAELTGKMRDIERQDVAWDREGKKFEDELLTNKARRSLIGAQTNQANAAAEHYRNESSDATASLKAQLAASKAEKAAAELLIKNSPLDANTMNTYEGKMKFLEGLKKLNIPEDEAASAYESLSGKFANGVRVGVNDKGEDVRIGLPVSTAIAAVEAAGKDSKLRPNWLMGSGRGDRTITQVERLMAEPSYVESLQQALQAQGIQYRALNKPEGAVTVSAKTNSRTTGRSIFPQNLDHPDYPGGAIMDQVIAARAERAKGMMTKDESEQYQKTGKIPFRIKRFLEEGNER